MSGYEEESTDVIMHRGGLAINLAANDRVQMEWCMNQFNMQVRKYVNVRTCERTDI